jgi:hypothetical protein
VAVPTQDPANPDFIVEMQLRKFNIVTFPRVKYLPKTLSKDIYVSRSDTIKEVLVKCYESNAFATNSEQSAGYFTNLGRLWKFEGQESFADIKEALEDIGGNTDKLPIEVHGRVL